VTDTTQNPKYIWIRPIFSTSPG